MLMQGAQISVSAPTILARGVFLFTFVSSKLLSYPSPALTFLWDGVLLSNKSIRHKDFICQTDLLVILIYLLPPR